MICSAEPSAQVAPPLYVSKLLDGDMIASLPERQLPASVSQPDVTCDRGAILRRSCSSAQRRVRSGTRRTPCAAAAPQAARRLSDRRRASPTAHKLIADLRRHPDVDGCLHCLASHAITTWPSLVFKNGLRSAGRRRATAGCRRCATRG